MEAAMGPEMGLESTETETLPSTGSEVSFYEYGEKRPHPGAKRLNPRCQACGIFAKRGQLDREVEGELTHRWGCP